MWCSPAAVSTKPSALAPLVVSTRPSCRNSSCHGAPRRTRAVSDPLRISAAVVADVRLRPVRRVPGQLELRPAVHAAGVVGDLDADHPGQRRGQPNRQ